MSASYKSNPRFYKGDQLTLSTELAVDSQTWHAGAPCFRTTTGKVKPVATSTGRILGFFADSQASSSSSSSAKVYRIPSTASQFIGWKCNGDNDTTATRADIGKLCQPRVSTNMCVDVGTAGIFKIVNVLYLVEGFKNTSTDSPAQVIFCVNKDSSLQ